MFNPSHIHPMIVHFPIALITIGFIADVAFLFFKNEKWLQKTAFLLMILGTLGACAAFASGEFFTNQPTQGEIVKVFESHTTAAFFTVVIMIIASILRIYAVMKNKVETNFKWIVFGLYFIGMILVSYTGFMGGTMVFNFMLGI